MLLTAALTPIRDFSEALRVGAELDCRLALSVWTTVRRWPGSPRVPAHAAEPTLRQSGTLSGHPELAFLSTVVTAIREATTESGRPDRKKIRLDVERPLPMALDFRSLQQGTSAIPTEVGALISAVGVLSAGAWTNPDLPRVRCRVREVLNLDTDPRSSTFGEYIAGEVFHETVLDVSNLGVTACLARLEVLSPEARIAPSELRAPRRA